MPAPTVASLMRSLSFTAALALVPAADSSAIPITDGLVGYWAGEGNADDGSGFGHHGVLVGDVTFVPGRVGQAFAFDGDGDAMRASAAALPTGAEDRTIAFWVQSEDYAVGNRFLAGWGSAADDAMSAIILGWFSATDRIPTFWGFFNDLPADEPLEDGAWHHLAFTLAGTSATWFVDGAEVATGTVNGLNTPAGTQFRLGDAFSVMSNFAGSIDEVAVYDRALTPEEIETLAVPEPAAGMCVGMGALILAALRRARVGAGAAGAPARTLLQDRAHG